MPEKTRLYLLAPVVRGRKGEYRKEMLEFQKKGFQRVKIDGTFYEIEAAPVLDKKFKHDIDVVVDRLVVRPDIAARLSESFETALDLADGIAIIESARRIYEGTRREEGAQAHHLPPRRNSPVRVSGFYDPGDRAAPVLLQ